MDSQEAVRSYDRLPDESELEWLAFVSYRDQGIGRLMGEAQRKYKENQGKTGGNSNRQFAAWRKEHRWDARVRDYDIDQERRERQQAMDSISEEVYEGVNEYRINTINLAKSDLAIAALSRSIVQKNLVALNQRPVPFSAGDARLAKIMAEIAVGNTKISANYAALIERAYHINVVLDQMAEDMGNEEADE